MSRSDLQALRRSGRGKVIAGILLFVGATGAAAWSFTRDTGAGNPEDPARVMIVSDARARGYEIALRDAGFDALEGTQETWVRKARDEFHEDPPGSDVQAVLALADRYGYGFVAFERPQSLDFSGLGVEGADAIDAQTEFAVVSAGDLGHPHVLTVNPAPSRVMRDPALPLLRALFRHEPLARLVDTDRNPTVADIKLRDRLGDALDALERVPKAEQMAANIGRRAKDELESGERGQSRPTVLGAPLEHTRAMALADGSILSIHRRFAVRSSNGFRVDLEFESEEVLMHRSDPGDEPVVCEMLAGGSLAGDESPRVSASADGTTVVTKTLSDGLVAWGYRPARGRCGFVRLGEVPPALPGMDPIGIPGPDGRVARSGTTAGQAVLSVTRAGTDGRTLLGMVDDVRFGTPAWVDDTHLVVGGRGPGTATPDALWILSIDAPLVALRLDATVFDGALTVHEIAASVGSDVDEGALPTILATVGGGNRRLYELRPPVSVEALFGSPGPAVDDRRRQGLPSIHELDSNRFPVRALTHEGVATQPRLSPSGGSAVVALHAPDLDRADENDDSEIVLIGLAPHRPHLKVLTRNALDDRAPMFVQGGAAVVFETRYVVPSTNWVTAVARAMPVVGVRDDTGTQARSPAPPVELGRPAADGRTKDARSPRLPGGRTGSDGGARGLEGRGGSN